MKKKGFTLIELLAVIVILAIIALIATPMIMDVIEKSRRGAAIESVNGILDTAKKYQLESMLEGMEYPTTIDLTSDILTYKGAKPESGTLVISENGKMSIIAKYGKYCIQKSYSDESPKVVEDSVCENGIVIEKVYPNGTEIYYNPETNQICSPEEANANVNEYGTPTGIKTGCMKWYTFNDSENAIVVNMILDHNTTPLVAWNSTGENTEMKEVAEALSRDTATWIDGLNPRLITANEVAQISGNTTWNSESATMDDWFSFGNNDQEYIDLSTVDDQEYKAIRGNYAWLFNNLHGSIRAGAGTIEDKIMYPYDDTENRQYMTGYWTSTLISGTSSFVWNVQRNGILAHYHDVTNQYHEIGLRPVITIKKSIIR